MYIHMPSAPLHIPSDRSLYQDVCICYPHTCCGDMHSILMVGNHDRCANGYTTYTRMMWGICMASPHDVYTLASGGTIC